MTRRSNMAVLAHCSAGSGRCAEAKYLFCRDWLSRRAPRTGVRAWTGVARCSVGRAAAAGQGRDRCFAFGPAGACHRWRRPAPTGPCAQRRSASKKSVPPKSPSTKSAPAEIGPGSEPRRLAVVVEVARAARQRRQRESARTASLSGAMQARRTPSGPNTSCASSHPAAGRSGALSHSSNAPTRRRTLGRAAAAAASRARRRR